ncbi:uncharacterized protein MYCGRDRAFT_93838 [Zymoseptoria tritici IPO323]|uniref:Ecp2 effector protein domain-containing protein n=1 Tax=Zymoseptoria tritici (strain CBS 115943 / IPO323) TaxID=336722 RepID=F9XD73_ZYMTI|nr:uncharacterized protein MYCGRDRAFT_93838 [Zymoseptoria tritici IPO323]EGP86843.1 hypothetical protein MYCGRDRAFT_93838 [Zymoseptoria tritici IPO323]
MHFLLPTTLLLTLSLAAPTPTGWIPGAYCNLTYFGNGGVWIARIDQPFNDGAGCKAVKATLKKSIKLSNKWSCTDDGAGMTRLKFATNFKNDKVNHALKEAYPMYDFVGGNVCAPYAPTSGF